MKQTRLAQSGRAAVPRREAGAACAFVVWLAMCLSLVPLTHGHAQATSAAPSARKEANILRIGNTPTVVTWARGLTDSADLEKYAATGFNTLYVLVDKNSESAIAEASALMSAAEAKNLYLVAAILPGAVENGDGQPMASDPTSSEYATAVADTVKKLAEALGKHPGLIGWSIEAVPPNGFPWGDGSFRSYLRAAYGDSVPNLNRSWGTAYASWDEVTMSGAADVDSGQPAGVGRARIDLAMYRQMSYADALGLWAKALRTADPGRLVFASALPDYRSIISVRTDFDGLILNTYPNVAEQDLATHNVHAIDIARRANQFAAIPTFLVDRNADRNRLANWMNEALVHGATGLALSDWSVVEQSNDLQDLVRQTADWLATPTGFPLSPAPKAAILYEPLAGGALRNGQGLYGYIDGLTPSEPTNLFALVRMGTRYGQVDVLSPGSLGTADLRQYGVILAPMAFYMPEDAQVALHDFVLRGGAAIVDAGAGMYQAAGTLDSVPPVLTEMFGMRYTEEALKDQPSELGSFGQLGQVGQPGVAYPVGPGEAGLTVDPDVAKFSDILSQFLSRPDVRKYLGEAFVGENGPGFRVRGLGRGYAVYAPTFLYETWAPTDPYFDDFHERMLSWQYDLRLVQPDALWPNVGVAYYANDTIGVVSPDGNSAIVDVYGVENRLYSVPLGAERLPNPEEDGRAELLFPGEALALARPLPIYVRTSDQGAVVTVAVAKYDAQGIELLVNGTGSNANVTRSGVSVAGGTATNVEIEIHSGTYALPRGSLHHVTVQTGSRNRGSEVDMMPNPETGLLVIHASIAAGRITITPAAAQ